MKRTDYNALKQIIYREIEKDMAQKKKTGTTRTEAFDINVFNKGMEWFASGLSLEDASEEDKKSIHFVNGYERAKRLARIEEMKKNNSVHR